jgi:hypothetical protein
MSAEDFGKQRKEELTGEKAVSGSRKDLADMGRSVLRPYRLGARSAEGIQSEGGICGSGRPPFRRHGEVKVVPTS